MGGARSEAAATNVPASLASAARSGQDLQDDRQMVAGGEEDLGPVGGAADQAIAPSLSPPEPPPPPPNPYGSTLRRERKVSLSEIEATGVRSEVTMLQEQLLLPRAANTLLFLSLRSRGSPTSSPL